MDYLLHIFTLISIYSILAISLNLLIGYTGLLSLCHAAFWGIGAYTTGLLCTQLGLSWGLATLIGIGLSFLFSLLVGAVSFRFQNEFFMLVTFAFQILIFNIMLNWSGLTKGAMGLPGIPGSIVFGWKIDSVGEYFLVALFFCVITFLVANYLTASSFGLALKTIREDEILAASLGKNIISFKIRVFVIAAVFASLAGSIYASYMSYIDPGNFTVQESIFIAALVLIGGSGSVPGSVVGAFLLVSIPELLRFLNIPVTNAANLRQMIYGFLLIAFMLWRPQGILGKYTFRMDATKP